MEQVGDSSMYIVDVIFHAMAVSYHVDHSTKKGQVIVHVFGDQWYSTALQ